MEVLEACRCRRQGRCLRCQWCRDQRCRRHRYDIIHRHRGGFKMEMTQQEFDLLIQQYYQNRVPDYTLKTPKLTMDNALAMDSGQGVLSKNPPKTKSTWDPWSIGLTAAMAAAPVAGSLLGKTKQYPHGGGGSASLGMTRGLEVPNVYSGRSNPIIAALLAQYLRRR